MNIIHMRQKNNYVSPFDTMRGYKNRFFFSGNHFFALKTYKNAMKPMISSFKMKVDVFSNNFLMLWFQKDYLDRVGGGPES